MPVEFIESTTETRSLKNDEGRYPENCSATELTMVRAVSEGACVGRGSAVRYGLWGAGVRFLTWLMQLAAAVTLALMRTSFMQVWSS